MSVESLLGLDKNPIVTGLWQVADMERGGVDLDLNKAANALLDYAHDGFCNFDMADHYGSAELIAGEARRRWIELAAADVKTKTPVNMYTKWCPDPDDYSYAAVKKAIGVRLDRLGVEQIDLLQLHWWNFEHPGYIDVMDHLSRLQQEGLIKQLGVTNFDTDHLRVLHACGFTISTNQVCLSVIDSRALGDMSAFCRESGVRLLAYGTLAGGFLQEKWLGRTAPDNVADWSKMKYSRFISAVGGWDQFQSVLTLLQGIAVRHSTTIANVATRWVLEQDVVAGVIIGARITQSQHRANNHDTLSLRLSDTDRQTITECSRNLTSIAGDCGTEYRRPPYLTASGDLSHHLQTIKPVYQSRKLDGSSNRLVLNTASTHEKMAGYSRAVRIGNRILISGTTATHGADRVIGEHDLQAQMVYILDKISASLTALGGTLQDVVRTRVYLADSSQWEGVARAHGRYFGDILPANTLIEVGRLIGPYGVEVEAEAWVE